MGNRRLGVKRLEAVMDNLLSHESLNGLNGSPFVVRDPDRVYLEEFFEKRPSANGDLDSGGTTTTAAELTTALIANKSFEILGVNHSTGDVTFDAVTGMLKLETDGTNQDAISLWPHQDTNQTKWAVAGMWGSENSPEMEIVLRTGSSLANVKIGAGLKLTEDASNNYTLGTDADQVLFYFATDDTEGALTTNANLHCVVSSGGTDYVTDLGFALAVDTTYRLGITINSDRQATAWVNGDQYSLTRLSTAGGVQTGKGTEKSVALANDKDLYPTVFVEQLAGSAQHIYVAYIKCSRIMFE